MLKEKGQGEGERDRKRERERARTGRSAMPGNTAALRPELMCYKSWRGVSVAVAAASEAATERKE